MDSPPTATPSTPTDRSTGTRVGVTRRWSKRQRRFIMLGFSLGVAGFLLVAMEVALRLMGYGGYAPTFRAAGRLEDGSTLVFSDHGGPSSYFFANRSNPGSLDRDAFVMPKPPGTLRVMVVGESAAKGIPQPRGLAWSAYLEAMLGDLWPERQVEVINLGTTAIAAYPALGMLKEALDQEPDVIVVWVGNNEFYGAYGVASLHSAGRTPWMIRAIRASRSLAIAQFVDRQMSPPAKELTKTLMETMVGRSSLGPDDPVRAAAARNLEEFVGEMVRASRARGVPVVVCTPPCNERDLAPLGIPTLAGLTVEERARVDQRLAEAERMLVTDRAQAGTAIEEVIQTAPELARAHFVRGRWLMAEGREQEAAESFRRAVDLDPMPWRPPSANVQAIRRAVEANGGVLCDLEAAFREGSPGRSTGWELMDDHVHPSLRGQQLAARRVAEAIGSIDAVTGSVGKVTGALRSDDEYAAALGANEFESYGVAYQMRLLAQVPFFNETNPEFLERTDKMCREFEARVSPEVREQMRAWAEQPTRDGERRPISGMVARELLRRGEPAKAEPLCRLAAGSVVPYGSWELEYTLAWLKCRVAANGELGEADRRIAREAIGRGKFLRSTGRSSTGAAEWYLGEIHQLLGEGDAAISLLETARGKLTGGNRAAVDVALVEAYLGASQTEKARQVVSEGLQGPREFLPTYSELLRRVDDSATSRP